MVLPVLTSCKFFCVTATDVSVSIVPIAQILLSLLTSVGGTSLIIISGMQEPCKRFVN